MPPLVPARPLDFSVIARSGVTQREFGDLAGVARVTVNLWVRGKMGPHRYTRAKIAKVLSMMEDALANHDLPLPETTDGAVRPAALKQAIRRAVQRSEPALAS